MEMRTMIQVHGLIEEPADALAARGEVGRHTGVNAQSLAEDGLVKVFPDCTNEVPGKYELQSLEFWEGYRMIG